MALSSTIFAEQYQCETVDKKNNDIFRSGYNVYSCPDDSMAASIEPTNFIIRTPANYFSRKTTPSLIIFTANESQISRSHYFHVLNTFQNVFVAFPKKNGPQWDFDRSDSRDIQHIERVIDISQRLFHIGEDNIYLSDYSGSGAIKMKCNFPKSISMISEYTASNIQEATKNGLCSNTIKTKVIPVTTDEQKSSLTLGGFVKKSTNFFGI